MDVKIRKAQTNLVSAGVGILVFAVWSVVRTTIFYFSGESTLLDGVPEDARTNLLIKITTIIMLVIVTLVDLLFRVNISRSAIAEGKGIKKRNGYLVCAMFLVLVYSAGIAIYAVGIAGKIDDFEILKMDTLITLIVDSTSLYILLLMILSAFRLRKLLQQQNIQQQNTGAQTAV